MKQVNPRIQRRHADAERDDRERTEDRPWRHGKHPLHGHEYQEEMPA